MNNFYGQQQYGWNNSWNPPQKTEVIKVHGEEGAKAFQLAPNSSVLLLDETAPIVWLKTTDGASYPTISGYKIEPIVQQAKTSDLNYKSLEDRIAILERMFLNDKSNTGNVAREPNNGNQQQQNNQRNK